MVWQTDRWDSKPDHPVGETPTDRVLDMITRERPGRVVAWMPLPKTLDSLKEDDVWRDDDEENQQQSRRDADLIAHAPTDLDHLLAVADAARKLLISMDSGETSTGELRTVLDEEEL
jgi:hypothetical protein